jgi:cellobiose-specific phosphotransferase system component IIC
MYCLLPTGTKKMLLKIIQSSIQSFSVYIGMVNEDFKIELKPIVCENVRKQKFNGIIGISFITLYP